MRKISVSDFTLRKLSESGTADLLFREKTAIAACIDGIGADKTELAPLTRVKEDTIIYKTIAGIVKHSTLAIPVGTSSAGVDAAWECVKAAAMPCLQVVLPVATAQMEYSFRAKDAGMLENIAALCKAAKEKCDNVEFVARDATRADADFLIRACQTAVENGAVALTICDDAGQSLPAEIAETVARVKAVCAVPLYVELSDAIHMAVACAVSAAAAGADGVKTSMVGDDVLSTGTFAEAVQARGAAMGVCTSLKMSEIHHDISEILRYIRHDEQTDGAAAAGEADIFLDAQSTLADVGEAVQSLGYDLTDEDCGKVYKALMQVCERRSAVGAKELEALIASNALQAPSTYHLENYVFTSNMTGNAMAQITLKKQDETVSGVATGDGPIDSAFRAIEQCVGHHYELDAFRIEAVTEGKEALGSALVRLRNQGKLYSGNGLSTDIVGASIRAYVNALNKIVFEEN